LIVTGGDEVARLYQEGGGPFPEFGTEGEFILSVEPWEGRRLEAFLLDVAVVRGNAGTLLTGFYGILTSTEYIDGPASVVRFGLRGLDLGFGRNGFVRAPGRSIGGPQVFACATDDEGVLVANVAYGPGGSIRLWRLSARGEPDRRFGPDGLRIHRAPSLVRLHPLPAEELMLGYGLGFGIDAAGRIIGAAFIQNSDPGERIAIIRCQPDGSLDTTFGPGGYRIVTLPSRAVASDRAFAVRPDGAFALAIATMRDFREPEFTVLRFNADGSPMSSFDGDGMAVYPVPDAEFARLGGIEFGPDDSIVVGGYTSESRSLLLLRARADGTLDPTFGEGGIRRHRPSRDTYITYVHDIAVDHGEVVAVGLLGVFP
jgi:uncharacterized delta-60 repeat protein